ncbi:MAG: 6-phosphofructokinase, partial [bacterium]|nr:6-phosphofructokinase [bacterium]
MGKNINHIGVFTSGGDSPGMNAALYAIAKAAEINGLKVSGIRRGYEGMIDGDFISLESQQLQKTVFRGGTILKTSRSDRFLTVKGRSMALEMLQKTNIDSLIAIGGDGTFRGLLAFSELCKLPFIGIPGTIDNDLTGTDYTLGFDSAVNTAIQDIDKIRDTAESHNRIFLIEVMGRDSGYIAINSGIGTGADAILIPESGEDFIRLLDKIRHYDSEEAFIVVVSEGDETGTELVASKIKEVNPKVDLRITKLGHVQRGGNPSAFDRMLGIRLGVASVKALLSG